MEKQRASKIIEFAFLNTDGHIRSEDMFEYDANELTDALRMAIFALRQNENQHVYIFKDEEAGDIICDLWTTSVPDIGEQIILWDKGEHHYYEVKEIRYTFLPNAMFVAQVFPPREDFVNVHENCFHLWQLAPGGYAEYQKED